MALTPNQTKVLNHRIRTMLNEIQANENVGGNAVIIRQMALSNEAQLLNFLSAYRSTITSDLNNQIDGNNEINSQLQQEIDDLNTP